MERMKPRITSMIWNTRNKKKFNQNMKKKERERIKKKVRIG